MMTLMQLAELHERAAETCGRIIGRITEDQWGQPTPCSDWNVRQLVNHIVSENYWVEPLLEGKTIEEVDDRFDGDVLENDPIGAYEASAKSATTAAFRPGALDAPVAVSYGPIPGAVYVGHRLVDLVVHGWDVAEATKQDTNIEYELADAVLEIVEKEQDELQASGAFGTPIQVGPDADAQTRLLAILGRRG